MKTKHFYMSLRPNRISQLPPLPFCPFFMWSNHVNLPAVPVNTLLSPTPGPLHVKSSGLDVPYFHQVFILITCSSAFKCRVKYPLLREAFFNCHTRAVRHSHSPRYFSAPIVTAVKELLNNCMHGFQYLSVGAQVFTEWMDEWQTLHKWVREVFVLSSSFTI